MFFLFLVSSSVTTGPKHVGSTLSEIICVQSFSFSQSWSPILLSQPPFTLAVPIKDIPYPQPGPSFFSIHSVHFKMNNNAYEYHIIGQPEAVYFPVSPWVNPFVAWNNASL